ncbi:2-keto-3-deoxy-6-phosphogalactonate aldolase [Azotobacter vinelandii CA]|uniref:2-keto-3-deoxy-6-phosphogalactonate aldolase n=2 Tax=Azotobacter vinelandii TaxID=354 RepID=C1DMD5_AZOVD|nr:2-dehydro-3-deoxy-6-phosphogalactonate aldolase [Azotobacter vinelandii]ACO81212.1 2-keto-3-deoxy-6-phosphogalactonate aldolase [Azotobacter vinelandii DJ]AGK13391.1 2-keto-3-deoxy-6-phosphogalactonate aldolase [Azotobacter vinelandii CA]AGK17759.1 2-keto-3-deoxy-6-phosphogalactonate aldolase [Azotobacter vinelandii CA6]WKN21955.1 2-dehydro-3-deoxy-6-phosphogalactonate aldolase [Azotobacter vinelandii]SFX64992.1 2-keto-3-deoxy-phosphogalactonate aldolase [Azotobacter vinelandii]
MFDDCMRQLPLVAILRGITAEEILPVGRVLYDAGFRLIEVPLNSPRPLESIRLLAAELGQRCLVGAGTVLEAGQIEAVAAAGGRLIVMPHSDARLIRAAKAAGLFCAPGVATPTEGFAALEAGADALKLFPAEQFGPAVVKAWRAVFARDIALLPVGGIAPDSLQPYLDAGASGFGLGSALYQPGLSAAEVGQRAAAFVAAWQRTQG